MCCIQTFHSYVGYVWAALSTHVLNVRNLLDFFLNKILRFTILIFAYWSCKKQSLQDESVEVQNVINCASVCKDKIQKKVHFLSSLTFRRLMGGPSCKRGLKICFGTWSDQLVWNILAIQHWLTCLLLILTRKILCYIQCTLDEIFWKCK